MRQNEGEELNWFEESIGMKLTTLEQERDCYVFIQSTSDTDYSILDKRFVSCFYGGGMDGYVIPNRAGDLEVVIINHSLGGNDGNGIYDRNFPGQSMLTTMYKDHDGNRLAAKDTNDNLWFMDFYHRSGSDSDPYDMFPEFHEIIAHAWGVPKGQEGKILDNLLEILKKISTDRVEMIKITTSFDKEAYIENVKREFETAVSLQSKISATKVNSLTRTLSIERTQHANTIKIECGKSFAQGMTVLKKLTDWEIKDNRLYYKKDIFVKQATLKGKIWDIPKEDKNKYYAKELSLTIEPAPTHATANNANHPNITGGGSVCIGDLMGKSLATVMEKLPAILEIGGLNSPFNGKVSKELYAYGVDENGEFKEDTNKSKIWDTRTATSRS